MKSRQFVIFIGSMIFVASMVLLDRSLLFSKRRMGETMSGDFIILKPCDEAQSANIGPLVPGQDNNLPGYPTSNSLVDPGGVVSPLNLRAGFSISTNADAGYWAGLLGSGWYLDWRVQAVSPVKNLEHWQMIRVREDCIIPSADVIRGIAAQYPGQVWIIGNEPDVIWQDNVTAETYTVLYHDLYVLIKAVDPSALVAVGGISQATPLRLQYLDRVLQTYLLNYHTHMPVDWWTVHGYVLREEKGSWGVDIPPGMNISQGELREVSDHGRIDLFTQQLYAFRVWMAERGYQDVPLALTEFGILMSNSYGFSEDSIAGYLEQSFTWLSEAKDEASGYPADGYRLVQRWAWFSLSDPIYPSANLGDLASGQLTAVGQRFHDIIQEQAP